MSFSESFDKSFRQGKRRKMTKFKLNEVSAVDKPAQTHAQAVIEKNSDDHIAKKHADFASFMKTAQSLGLDDALAQVSSLEISESITSLEAAVAKLVETARDRMAKFEREVADVANLAREDARRAVLSTRTGERLDALITDLEQFI